MYQQTRAPQQRQAHNHLPQPQTESERIQSIAQDLKDSSSAIESASASQMTTNLSRIISNMLSPVSMAPSTTSYPTQAQIHTTTSSSSVVTPIISQNDIPVLHLAEDINVRVITPLVTTSDPPRSASADSSSCVTPAAIATSQSATISSTPTPVHRDRDKEQNAVSTTHTSAVITTTNSSPTTSSLRCQLFPNLRAQIKHQNWVLLQKKQFIQAQQQSRRP